MYKSWLYKRKRELNRHSKRVNNGKIEATL